MHLEALVHQHRNGLESKEQCIQEVLNYIERENSIKNQNLKSATDFLYTALKIIETYPEYTSNQNFNKLYHFASELIEKRKEIYAGTEYPFYMQYCDIAIGHATRCIFQQTGKIAHARKAYDAFMRALTFPSINTLLKASLHRYAGNIALAIAQKTLTAPKEKKKWAKRALYNYKIALEQQALTE